MESFERELFDYLTVCQQMIDVWIISYEEEFCESFAFD